MYFCYMLSYACASFIESNDASNIEKLGGGKAIKQSRQQVFQVLAPSQFNNSAASVKNATILLPQSQKNYDE